MNKEEALKLWDDIYDGALWAQDCFGSWMYRNDYGQYEKKRIRLRSNNEFNYGWEVDHIKPQSSFTNKEKADSYNNLEIMHFINNRIKSDKTVFVINNVEYEIVECDICKKHHLEGYGILNKRTNNRVDWKYTRRAYYGE